MKLGLGIPEVFASIYNVRALLDETSSMRDHRELPKWHPEPLRMFLISRLDGTEVGELLHKHHLLLLLLYEVRTQQWARHSGVTGGRAWGVERHGGYCE